MKERGLIVALLGLTILCLGATTLVNLSFQVTGILPATNLPTLSGGGYLVPAGIPGQISNGSATLVLHQNEMDCIRFIAPFNITATHFSYRPTASAGVSSHVGFAIYSGDGTTRIMTTGALDGTAVTKQTATVSSFSLVWSTPYLYCWTDDASTSTTWATFAISPFTSSSGAVIDAVMNTTATSNLVKGATASVAGAPPSALSTLTAISTVQGFPAGFIEP